MARSLELVRCEVHLLLPEEADAGGARRIDVWVKNLMLESKSIRLQSRPTLPITYDVFLLALYVP